MDFPAYMFVKMYYRIFPATALISKSLFGGLTVPITILRDINELTKS
ncbi:hypothetical protein DNHGIG_20550 [Collibacillus ludicampi]|uniref:Uncharacterized protein n=1 Tax=Collibacillus ludicampi TaxID=2771369 RepID=A0AAV4LFA6_9BACL|nr:hypothetical protein DNHGIG_20550 [Collibacillus ludicampi]